MRIRTYYIKRTMLIALIMTGFISQIDAKEIAKSFVENYMTAVSNWSSTKETKYQEIATSQFDKKGDNIRCTFHDSFTRFIINNYSSLRLSNYDNNGVAYRTFWLGLQHAIDDGTKISMASVREVPPEEWIAIGSPKNKNLSVVVYKFDVTSNNNGKTTYENQAFVSERGIQKIGEAQYVIDPKTGKRKLKVDFKEMTDEMTDEHITFTYNYSKYFPVGLSLAYEYRHLFIGGDFGYSLNKDKTIVTKDISYIDENNYKYEERIYDKKLFFTISPGYTCRLFSLSCGLGTMILNGEKNIYTAESKEESGSGWSTSGKSETNTSENHKLFKFMVRPSLKFYIPINIDWDEYFIVAGVGYDYVCGFSKANGINFSLGFKFMIL